MFEPSSNEHVKSHPICLRRGHWVYEDENHRMWLPLLLDIRGDRQVRLRQKDLPRGHCLLTSSPLFSSTLPWVWWLHPGGHYQDPMFQLWRIVYHVNDNGVEEMTLQLMKDL